MHHCYTRRFFFPLTYCPFHQSLRFKIILLGDSSFRNSVGSEGFNTISCEIGNVQGGSNMTGTVYTCLHTNQSRSYLNHLVFKTKKQMTELGGM